MGERLLTVDDVERLAIGATVLGTGGGGDPYIGKLMAIQAIEEYGPVRLIDAADVPDDELVIPSAMMGAPTVMVEKIPNGSELVNAFRAIESYLGRRAAGTVSAEAGGINSTTPIATAARLGLPLIDADGMGRAFPEIQMTSFSVNGISATPMVLTDEKGNTVLLETPNNLWTERLARSVTVTMGCSAMITLYPMTGAQVKKFAVHHTISYAVRLGEAVLEARAKKQDPVSRVIEETGGYRLFRGKIVDVLRRTTAGFARGTVKLEGTDDCKGRSMEIEFQNENLVALEDGRVVASVPDLITMLENETGSAITTEGLKYGYRVTVIGIPCAPVWRTREGLDVVGPRYFGYDIDYLPIEERMAAR